MQVVHSLVALGLLLFWAGVATAASPPNVLFILIEDQGYQMGALGTPGLETPHMDRLAQRGVFFRRAYVAYPVCSASKGALYTGLYPHTNGIRANTVNNHKPVEQLTAQELAHPLYRRLRVAEEYPTLIEKLHTAGYFTGVTHKLHVGPNEKFPYDRWIRATDGKVMTQFIVEAQRAEKPWFLMYNIRHPHRPFRNSDHVAIGVDPEAVDPPDFLPPTPIIRQDWAEYLDNIELSDAFVGEALDALDASGEAPRTIVIMMSDHGPSFHRGKMAPYDLGLHVPLAIAGPGMDVARQSNAVVSEIDLMPTILDLLGIDRPDLEHGRSLVPLLSGARENWDQPRYVVGEIHHSAQQHDQGMQERSITDGEYRLIYRERRNQPRTVNADLRDAKPWGNRAWNETILHKKEFPEAYRFLTEIAPQQFHVTLPAVELYDTASDPDEINDLSESEEMAKVRDRLMAQLRHWARETDDTFLAFP